MSEPATFMVAKRQDLDWDALLEWADVEGIERDIVTQLVKDATK